MDVINTINILSNFTDKQILDALMDGMIVKSNPLLTYKRDALRTRVKLLGERLIMLASEAEITERIIEKGKVNR